MNNLQLNTKWTGHTSLPELFTTPTCCARADSSSIHRFRLKRCAASRRSSRGCITILILGSPLWRLF